MQNACYIEKDSVVEILSQSFQNNLSVNYIINGPDNKYKYVRRLMAYSFELCFLFGEVLFSDDKKAVALILYPEKKKVSLKTIWLDVKLIFTCTGIPNAVKAIRREAAVKQVHPSAPLAYLWFIGVKPEDQHNGSGSDLLASIIRQSKIDGRQLVLETSTVQNVPWYLKYGFVNYHELDFGYKLYCLKLA